MPDVDDLTRDIRDELDTLASLCPRAQPESHGERAVEVRGVPVRRARTREPAGRR